MKRFYLIVILLLPIWMMGQTWQTDSTQVKLPVITLKAYNSASKTTPMEDELLGLLTKYQTECYNDSTRVVYNVIQDWQGKVFYIEDDNDPFTMEFGLIRKEVGYHHKQPTFTGFIEWLKERSE